MFDVFQFSDDRDPKPDVRESRGATQPTRGPAVLPARCGVGGLGVGSLLNDMNYVNVVAISGVVCGSLQMWLRAQRRLPVRGGALLGGRGHQHSHVG